MRITKAGNLIKLFGGVRALHHATDAADNPIDKATISRWTKITGPRAGGGTIPPQFNAAILAAAQIAVMPSEYTTRQSFVDDVDALLEHACPCCGAPLEEKTKLNSKQVKAHKLVKFR